jgi:hypothetical protein
VPHPDELYSECTFSHGEGYQSHILEYEKFKHSYDIIGNHIITITNPRLVRFSKAAYIPTGISATVLR